MVNFLVSITLENILENPLNIVLTICKFKKFKFRFAYVLSFKNF